MFCNCWSYSTETWYICSLGNSYLGTKEGSDLMLHMQKCKWQEMQKLRQFCSEAEIFMVWTSGGPGTKHMEQGFYLTALRLEEYCDHACRLSVCPFICPQFAFRSFSRTTSLVITIFIGHVGPMDLHKPIDFWCRPTSNMAAMATILNLHSTHYLKNDMARDHHFRWACWANGLTQAYRLSVPPSIQYCHYGGHLEFAFRS